MCWQMGRQCSAGPDVGSNQHHCNRKEASCVTVTATVRLLLSQNNNSHRDCQ